MAKRILITGGGGFIGGHLAHQLAKDKDNQILIVDDFSKGRKDTFLQNLLANDNVDLLDGDLQNATLLDEVNGEYDELYHLAALLGVENVVKNPGKTLRVNTYSTFNVFEWALAGRAHKIVFASTSEVMSWTQLFYDIPFPTPENVPLAITDVKLPRSTYAASKFYGELALTHLANEKNAAFSILRYGNVYGARMGYSHVIPELSARIFARRDPLLVYSPKNTRAFCHVDDAVALTRLVMESEFADGETFNCSNDKEEVSILALAKKMLAIENFQPKLDLRENKNDMIKRRCLSMAKAKDLLDFEPQVSLDEGLAKTMAWYRDDFNNNNLTK